MGAKISVSEQFTAHQNVWWKSSMTIKSWKVYWTSEVQYYWALIHWWILISMVKLNKPPKLIQPNGMNEHYQSLNNTKEWLEIGGLKRYISATYWSVFIPPDISINSATLRLRSCRRSIASSQGWHRPQAHTVGFSWKTHLVHIL